MLYREESQYMRMKNQDENSLPHREEFVECLRNALKIMETKYPASEEE